MVKKDKKKPVKKRVVKKVVKQTQTQKQTVVVNIDTKKAPIRRRRAPTPRQQEPAGIQRFIRMNEPPQTLMNTGAMGMNVREPLKNIGDYSQMGLGQRTDAQRQQEMIDSNMKFLDRLESRKEPIDLVKSDKVKPIKKKVKRKIILVDLERQTESDKATTLPEKVAPPFVKQPIEKVAPPQPKITPDDLERGTPTPPTPRGRGRPRIIKTDREIAEDKIIKAIKQRERRQKIKEAEEQKAREIKKND
tara:strand:- start:817 stop:1557 length:741 start_codon:yes stop_codon:yes gene_type:complete